MTERVYKKVNPSAIKLWIINGIISSLFTMGIAYAIYHFANIYVSYWPLAIGGLLSFLSIFVHPFIEYKQWKYCIAEDRVEFTHGVYYKSKNIIPISKIQHLEIIQGPIQKLFHLSSIEIYTAGASHKIEAILTAEADQIVESLNKSILISEIGE
ncbi:PH domain-containing protein [Clostridium vincentii]|uniref:Bacterial membrane flanked domain protein n=1 Tax=Clostridium vincentii TaxID=52704 RepID=A0A2T0BFM2_9CLOT|nr:PH domain-containing protein [Clostridium vincentii]PRR82622.1 Bacterial membrane flanked domain protein [Clostridium vincentii]